MTIEEKKIKEKIKWKGGTMLSPLPCALVSCGSLEKPNIITIGWTGILSSDPPKTYVSIRPSRYSYDIIKESKKFVVNLSTEELAKAADFCGVRSGKNTDKFKACNLTVAPALELEDTPVIAESPLSLECRVTDIVPLGTHDMFVADIVSVGVNPDLVDSKGALHLEKSRLIAYAHGDYFALGRKLGDFGYSVRKKAARKRRAKK